MLTYLQIKSNGDVVEKNAKSLETSTLYKCCSYKSDKDFECIHSFAFDSEKYMVYGKKCGRANNENKYDLPPPVDTILLFGTLCVVKKCDDEFVSLTSKEWSKIYETLFGGFEDLDSEEERSVDSEVYSDEDYTKEGYLKDNFVVDDNELEEEDYIEE
tara:strand:- start:9699 stop:10172 length:474 start_codon:yes stop_codon:yes gene_type:complete